ncbi:hypothetical protein ACQP1K_01445 [Sphaerimonospora sp. CA-214678]|uniref:hypothetical protein n=1 Tax=Sphaerimonospora sp. CA-214678 TaxID=3240029 RepID=UPI003D8B68E8
MILQASADLRITVTGGVCRRKPCVGTRSDRERYAPFRTVRVWPALARRRLSAVASADLGVRLPLVEIA